MRCINTIGLCNDVVFIKLTRTWSEAELNFILTLLILPFETIKSPRGRGHSQTFLTLKKLLLLQLFCYELKIQYFIFVCCFDWSMTSTMKVNIKHGNKHSNWEFHTKPFFPNKQIEVHTMYNVLQTEASTSLDRWKMKETNERESFWKIPIGKFQSLIYQK